MKHIFVSLLLVMGLAVLLAFERSLSLPLFFTYFSFIVMSKTSKALQAILAIVLGLLLAIVYMMPLWVGVSLLSIGFLLQERARFHVATVLIIQIIIFFVAGMSLTSTLLWILSFEVGVVVAVLLSGFIWDRVQQRFYLSRRLN